MHLKNCCLPVMVIVLAAWQCTAQPAPTLNSTIRKQVIDSIANAVRAYYVYPDKGRQMSLQIQQRFRKGAYDLLSDPRDLSLAITNDLRALQPDNHLAVRYDPDLERRIRTFKTTLQKDKSELEAEQKQNFFFRKVEILQGNIGYILFTNFSDTNEMARKTVRASMQFVAHADALILDLRNNFGGRMEMARELAAWFFEQPTFVGRSFNRINNSWTEDWVGHQPAISEGLLPSMPIYILTSNRTYSAAESFAYTLQHQKNALVIGDTTRGGAHATRSFALGNGFVGFIPFSRSENVLTKTDWEGTGIIPDVTIDEDSALLKAQMLILEQRWSAIADEAEKRKLRWIINDLKTQMQKITLAEKVLQTYTGTFEEFEFTLENGILFCRNTHQRNKKDRLIPIDHNLFRIDNESQVEFIKANGRVDSIRLFWNDGWVDTIRRSQR